MNNFRILIFIFSLTLFASCKREFNSNGDFNSDVPAEVYGDNTLLYSKIFRFANNSNYLWFDIRNEIANFSTPALGLGYNENGIDRSIRIDLRGRLYEYNSEAEELKVLGYPLRMATGTDSPADLVFRFARKQKEGCELITDPAQRSQCERTFTLSLKSIEFTELGLSVPVGSEITYNGKTLLVSALTQDIYLTN